MHKCRGREKYNPDYAIVLTWTLLMTLYWYRSMYAVGFLVYHVSFLLLSCQNRLPINRKHCR